jgi:hypothetical protein
VTRTASVSTILPDAGKPQGRCEECGPHGNGGRVELLFSVVDCLVCAWRADFDARRWIEEVGRDSLESPRRGEEVVVVEEISPLDPARVWGRRIKVTCTYADTTNLSVTGQGVIHDPCSRCGATTLNCARMMNLITNEWVHLGPTCP